MNCYYGGQNYTLVYSLQFIVIFLGHSRDLVDCDGEYKYIIWDNREIEIDGKTVFYKQYLSKGIRYTKDLLYDKTNIDSFNILKEKSLSVNSNFLTWSGLRHAVPLNLRTHPAYSFTVTLDRENFKCRNYYSLLIKFKYEKPMQRNGLRVKTNLIWRITVFQKPFCCP